MSAPTLCSTLRSCVHRVEVNQSTGVSVVSSQQGSFPPLLLPQPRHVETSSLLSTVHTLYIELIIKTIKGQYYLIVCLKWQLRRRFYCS